MAEALSGPSNVALGAEHRGYQKTSTWRGLSDELVHTKTSQGLMGQTLPLDLGQELNEDKLLSLAFETLHHHTMADAQKTELMRTASTILQGTAPVAYSKSKWRHCPASHC